MTLQQLEQMDGIASRFEALQLPAGRMESVRGSRAVLGWGGTHTEMSRTWRP